VANLCILFIGVQSGSTKVVECIDLFHMHIRSINVMVCLIYLLLLLLLLTAIKYLFWRFRNRKTDRQTNRQVAGKTDIDRQRDRLRFGVI
jgi:heme/copper-type cytochrome/quinol oxidase subunit 2